MGRVYLASSPGGRAVAVKVIHPHLARDPAFADRFRREVAAALAVNGGYAAPVVAADPGDVSRQASSRHAAIVASSRSAAHRAGPCARLICCLQQRILPASPIRCVQAAASRYLTPPA
jgi:hypothetical protein